MNESDRNWWIDYYSSRIGEKLNGLLLAIQRGDSVESFKAGQEVAHLAFFLKDTLGESMRDEENRRSAPTYQIMFGLKFYLLTPEQFQRWNQASKREHFGLYREWGLKDQLSDRQKFGDRVKDWRAIERQL